MKKFNFWLLASLFAAAFTLTACGDDEDGDNVEGAASDLVGTWSMDDMTYVFTKDNLTIKYGDQVSYNGPYTYANGYLEGASIDGDEAKLQVKFLYNKSVLVLKYVPENADDYSLDEVAIVLYKNGKAPNTSANDIQGTWHWYMRGDPSYVRTGVIIKGSTIEIIVTPWAERHVGTFTYQGGILHLNMTEFYSGRGEHGWGDGNGGINPATLECDNWIPCTKEDIGDHLPSEMMFITDGKEAYGYVAGLPAVFVKK